MRSIATLLCAAALLLSLAPSGSSADEPETKAKKLVHVVSFKFKPDTKPEAIKEVVDAFRELKKKISGVNKLEWGTNISPEKHDKGFTHVFVLSFKTAQDRDDYLVHPDHKAFGKILGPVLADVMVMDYWAQH